MGSRLIAFVVSVVLLVGSFGTEASSRAMAASSRDVPAAVEQALMSTSANTGSPEHRPLEERPAPSGAEPSAESSALPSPALKHPVRALTLARPARPDAALQRGPYLDGILRPPRLRSIAA